MSMETIGLITIISAIVAIVVFQISQKRDRGDD